VIIRSLGAAIFYIKLLQMEHATKASRGIHGAYMKHDVNTFKTAILQKCCKCQRCVTGHLNSSTFFNGVTPFEMPVSTNAIIVA